MSVQLKFKDGSEFPMPPRYWSFFLCLAETCEWKPAGTKKPQGWGFLRKWDGGSDYESTDGRQVTDSDAREFSNALNRCYYSDHCLEIMKLAADKLESQVEAEAGMKIPAEMRIDVSTLRDALGKLMAMTHKSGFAIS